MGKVIGVTAYRNVPDPEALAAYGKGAAVAIAKFGGRVLARGVPLSVVEAGIMDRIVIVEWDSLEAATGAYASDEYQAARKLLGDVERDIRYVAGAE